MGRKIFGLILADRHENVDDWQLRRHDGLYAITVKTETDENSFISVSKYFNGSNRISNHSLRTVFATKQQALIQIKRLHKTFPNFKFEVIHIPNS